jgi:hypothetical protein
MGKGINIKVSKDKLVTALKEKLSEVCLKQSLYEVAVETHKGDWKDYQEAIKKIAFKNLDSVTDVTESRWQSGDDFTAFEIKVKIDNSKLPTEPEEPTPPYQGGRGHGRNYVSNNYDDIFADLTNAIRMLEMSDEDVVSTATYASVSRFL